MNDMNQRLATIVSDGVTSAAFLESAFNTGELRMVGMSIAHSLDRCLYHGLQMRVSILLTSYRDAQKRHKLT